MVSGAAGLPPSAVMALPSRATRSKLREPPSDRAAKPALMDTMDSIGNDCRLK